MDEVEGLFLAFRQAKATGAYGNDYPDQIDVIEELAFLDDERIAPFFVEILADEMGYDLARVAVCRVLRYRDFHEHHRPALAHVLCQVALHDPDLLVRQWATMALHRYTDIDGVLDAVRQLVLDREEDEDVRHNAFDALVYRHPPLAGLPILRSLLDDEVLGRAARSALTKWGED